MAKYDKPRSSGSNAFFLIAISLIAIIVIGFGLYRTFTKSTDPDRAADEALTATGAAPTLAPVASLDKRSTRATPWPVHPAATADPKETPLPNVWPPSTPDPSAPRESENSKDDAHENGEASTDDDGN